MLFIGNQIRLQRAPLAAAVERRYELLIQTLARRQVEAGATWLLVDVGPRRKQALDDLTWLVKTIHATVNVPLALRTDDPAALEAGILAARDMILIDATLPAVHEQGTFIDLARRFGARLALSACPGGLPLPTEERVSRVTGELLPAAQARGLPLDHFYVDPLLAALTCDQSLVPAAVETIHLLKVAADPSPNTLVHLDDIADGVADAARPFISHAYVTMLMAAGIDALVANPLDPGLVDVIRVVRDREPITAYDRLLLRLFDVTKAGADLDPAAVDRNDPDQLALLKTVQVLANKTIYADSYLRG